MIHRTLKLLGMFTVVMLHGCVAPVLSVSPQPSVSFDVQQVPKLAVIVEDLTGEYRRNEAVIRQVEDAVNEKLLLKGYRLASRSDSAAIMKEIHFQQSGLTEEGAAKTGRMLNVPGVLVVSITRSRLSSRDSPLIINGRRSQFHRAEGAISARLVFVETAEIWWMNSFAGSVSVDSKNEAEQALPHVASVVADGFPSRLPAAPSPTPGVSTN